MKTQEISAFILAPLSLLVYGLNTWCEAVTADENMEEQRPLLRAEFRSIYYISIMHSFHAEYVQYIHNCMLSVAQYQQHAICINTKKYGKSQRMWNYSEIDDDVRVSLFKLQKKQ